MDHSKINTEHLLYESLILTSRLHSFYRQHIDSTEYKSINFTKEKENNIKSTIRHELCWCLQRHSVQEVPPVLNGDSTRSQQQCSIPSYSQSDHSLTQDSPQTSSDSGRAAAGSSAGASPHHSSTPLSTSASPLTDGGASGSASPAASIPSTSSSAEQQSAVLLATNTSNLSPSLIPSTVMSLNQVAPADSSSQGMTLPISHSAPHSPPLPHSAPLSRSMTPVQLLHQQVGPGGSSTSSLAHNPWFMKAVEMSATATLPLPRRPGTDVRLGGFQGKHYR